MAKRKPQTRFVVEVGGELYRLASVRELTGGGLIITVDSAGIGTIRGGKPRSMLNVKYSVHPSTRSATSACLVHMTTTFSDETRDELHLLTHAIRDHRFEPVFVKTTPRPIREGAITPGPRDRVLNLGQFNPNTHSFHFGLWLCERESSRNLTAHGNYSIAGALFRHFAVVVPYCFTAEPANPIGRIIHYATTSAARLSPQASAAGHKPGISKGIALADFPSAVLSTFARLTEDKSVNQFMTPVRAEWRDSAITLRFRSHPEPYD